MNFDWGQIAQWFTASIVDGSFVKAVDYLISRRLAAKNRNAEKVDAIRNYIRLYGELVELYRFRAYVSMHVVQDERGEFILDEEGKPLVESKILEPEPRFEEAIRDLTGEDLDAGITNRIAALRIASSEALDLAQELDPSGQVREELGNLYIKTIQGIETVLKHKNSVEPGEAFSQLIDGLKAADEARRQVRIRLENYT